MVAVSSPIFAIEQNLEMIKVGEDKFLHWYGHTGRTYFVQVSDPNDLLRTWIWCPVIETGNDEEIWHLCGGTADKGFFRLKYTDQPTTDPENDDFDGDSLSNLHEISYYNSDPLDSDTDNDGMPDEFEAIYFFDLNFDEGGYDYDGDGLTNLGEFIAGTEPYYSDTDGDGMNDGFEVTHSLDPLNAADATDDDTVQLTRSMPMADAHVPPTLENPVVESRIQQQLGRQMTVKTFLLLLLGATLLTIVIVVVGLCFWWRWRWRWRR
jgi:hypothetical protein